MEFKIQCMSTIAFLLFGIYVLFINKKAKYINSRIMLFYGIIAIILSFCMGYLLMFTSHDTAWYIGKVLTSSYVVIVSLISGISLIFLQNSRDIKSSVATTLNGILCCVIAFISSVVLFLYIFRII